MDDSGPTASYVFFVIVLIIDALFYTFGAAVQALGNKEFEEQPEEGRSKKTKRLCKIVTAPGQFINTLQLVITLMNIIIGSSIFPATCRDCAILLRKTGIAQFVYINNTDFICSILSIVLSGIIIIFIILTFGVLIPKKVGKRYPMGLAMAFINPITILVNIFSPFTWLVAVSAKGILRLFGIKTSASQDDVTEEEIISMVNEGHEQGVLLATEAEMINKIFEFGDKEAQDIMTHRKNILAIDKNMTLAQALDYMLSESKSRYPVYEENIDHIVGILHFRDAFRARQEDKNLNKPVGEIDDLIRETMFIPETKNIDALFQTMQSTKTQMVIVVDEYGQTTGLLAMEDILEEIVGNIMDEYDEDEAYIEETENADEYIIDGLTPLEELEDRFSISFQEDEFETLNGFMISKMDKIPDENEKFSMDIGGYRFEILSVENRMIKSVLVTNIKN